MFRHNKHRHTWEVVESTYYPPVGDFKAKRVARDLIDEALFGVTFVNYRCTCGRVAQDRMLGRYTPPDFEYPEK